MGQLSIDEDEMRTIVRAMRMVRLFSKHKTAASLLDYLFKEEMIGSAQGKLYWKNPELKLFKKVEDKFAKRLKELGYSTK